MGSLGDWEFGKISGRNEQHRKRNKHGRELDNRNFETLAGPADMTLNQVRFWGWSTGGCQVKNEDLRVFYTEYSSKP